MQLAVHSPSIMRLLNCLACPRNGLTEGSTLAAGLMRSQNLDRDVLMRAAAHDLIGGRSGTASLGDFVEFLDSGPRLDQVSLYATRKAQDVVNSPSNTLLVSLGEASRGRYNLGGLALKCGISDPAALLECLANNWMSLYATKPIRDEADKILLAGGAHFGLAEFERYRGGPTIMYQFRGAVEARITGAGRVRLPLKMV